jgi:hypothetical protein
MQGQLLDTIILTQDYFDSSNWNYALCAHSAYNGSLWIGGNINDDEFGKAGFIIILDTTYIIPTTIINQPVNSSACLGNQITLSVTVSGVNLNYQWRKNGVNLINVGNISGADSSELTINPVSVSDAGTYDVVITPLSGSPLTSDTATIIVDTPPLAAGTINGPTTVCRHTTHGFSVPPIIGATIYNWTIPLQAQILYGQGTNSIVVNFKKSQGNITVHGLNQCGDGQTSVFPVQVTKCFVANHAVMRSNNETSEIKIFPNPAYSELNIHFISETEETIKIKLYDAVSRIIINENSFSELGLNEKQIALSQLNPGIYVLEIIINNEIIREKIVVDR